MSAAYVVSGALSVAAGREPIVGVVLLFLGIAYGAWGQLLLPSLAPPA